IKIMHGAFFLPCSKRSRTRLAPTPTNISTKSEPEMEKNGTFASPAIARAKPLEFLRVLQEVDDLLQLFLGFFDSRYILKRRLLLLRSQQPRARFSKA